MTTLTNDAPASLITPFHCSDWKIPDESASGLHPISSFSAVSWSESTDGSELRILIASNRTQQSYPFLLVKITNKKSKYEQTKIRICLYGDAFDDWTGARFQSS